MRQSSSPDHADPNAGSVAPGESGTSAHTTVLPETTVIPGENVPGKRRFGRGRRGADPVIDHTNSEQSAYQPGADQAWAQLQQPEAPARPVSVGGSEQVIMRLRRHGHRLLFPVLVLIAVAALTGFFVGGFEETWQNVLVGVGAIVVALVLGLLPILSWMNRRVTVTTERLIESRGLFVRTRSDVSLSRVRDVRTKQHLGQRVWGSGDLLLSVGAETRKFQDLPGIEEIRRAVQILSEESFANLDQALGSQTVNDTPKSFFQ
ncbi:PH domain-containing protein [Leucobacter sp. cx-42]|uniref:PH domain-containing protein n=1 Tax=unclassified Leucobacter TaxID=2621730 RepID=UPI00165DF5E7|nr:MULTISPECIES: PH domain-containing protein [unclassified Leucobacter]MBC9953600.1 PH domain-containing protein [Leucobacter sp. cx-42]